MLALGRRFWHRTVCVSTSDVQIVEDSFVRCKKFFALPGSGARSLDFCRTAWAAHGETRVDIGLQREAG